MECPTRRIVPPFALRFAYIVKHGSPTQPEIIRLPTDVIHHFERVIKVILMRFPISCLHDIELHKFRKNQIEQPATIQFVETAAGLIGHHNLIELIGNAFAADDPNAISIAFE